MSKELEQNIKRIEAELAEMKAELEKSKKFEWKYPANETYQVTGSYVSGENGGASTSLLEHGRYRLSKQYAEHSLERNRVANRLEALVEQIEPDYVVPGYGEQTWYIYEKSLGKYDKGDRNFNRLVGQVYMSKETATKICELLNSGEMVL